MLALSDTPIEGVLPIFASRGIDVTFLVPTPTGYEKSIMDAIAPVREFLKSKGIHDYAVQRQGQTQTRRVRAYLVGPDSKQETVATLYRPETKQGDPRIWFHSLKQYCKPRNLLGIITDGESLYVFNLSNPSVVDSITRGGEAAEALKHVGDLGRKIADELLAKLNAIHRRGFVPTVTAGDTGVGMTLERLLLIPPNSSKKPDYRGIELKAGREKKSPDRVNLFSQVPDWSNSHGMTAKQLLAEYGYWADERGARRFNLYCTVEAKQPNPQGLYFDVNLDQDLLINMASVGGISRYVVQWSLADLRNRLLEKHRETFWVKVTAKTVDGVEHFRYDRVVHTSKPNASLLGHLCGSSVITMDYTMHLKPSGGVRDHGYLFKIKPQQIRILFPDPVEYGLE